MLVIVEAHVVEDEAFVLLIAPLLFRVICPVDIMRAAYCALLCMLVIILKTPMVATKPNTMAMSGVEAKANSSATEPRRAARMALRRRRIGPGVKVARVDASRMVWGRRRLIINPIFLK